MADLTIDTIDPTATGRQVPVTITLVDADREQVTGYADDGSLVTQWRGETDTEGTVTVDLVPNADITPANTYYLVVTQNRQHLIEKSAATQTLLEALIDDPEALGSVVMAAHLAATDPHPQYSTDVVLAAHEAAANPHPGYATDADLSAHVAAADPHPVYQLRGFRPLSALMSRLWVFSHSYGTLGATDDELLWCSRVADRSPCPIDGVQAAGQRLLNAGRNDNQSGFGQIMDAPVPATAYNAVSYVPWPGLWVLMHGINDLEEYGDTATLTQFLACWRQVLNACIAWLSLASYHHHDAAATGQTLAGSGAWSLSVLWSEGFEEGPGTTRAYNSTAGCTVTVVTGANAAGRKAALYFPANWNGGPRQSSIVTVTRDGTPLTAAQVQLETLDLRATAPADVAHGVCVAMIIDLPDDGLAHTIVVTGGTGGLTYSGYGIIATEQRPGLVANCARRSNAYVGEATDAKVAQLNTVTADAVNDWGSTHIGVLDIDAVLDANPLKFYDGLHPNNGGHADVAIEAEDTIDSLVVSATAKGAV